MKTPRELKDMYDQGINITEYVKNEVKTDANSIQTIQMAYDMQAGSSIDLVKTPEYADFIEKNTSEIAAVIRKFCPDVNSVLEAGVGDGISLFNLMRHMNKRDCKYYGFDLCWSRVACALNWAKKMELNNYQLAMGSLFQIPMLDNSVDVTFTVHTIEPNTGREKEALEELYRVTKRFLVLLEPEYVGASEEVRERMDRLGYCKNIYGSIKDLGYKVVEHTKFPYAWNPLNPVMLTVIEKEGIVESPSLGDNVDTVFACPQFRTPLISNPDGYFSPEALSIYPTIGGVPCLRAENAIFASKFEELYLD